MPKSKKINTEEILSLVAELFAEYKTFIVKQFVEKFGKSYQTPEDCAKTWRKDFKYAEQCEEFLKIKTKTFLNTQLPSDNKICSNMNFLNKLIYNISDYLSHYVSKKTAEAKASRNVYTNELISIFSETSCVKNAKKQININHTIRHQQAIKLKEAKRKIQKKAKEKTNQTTPKFHTQKDINELRAKLKLPILKPTPNHR